MQLVHQNQGTSPRASSTQLMGCLHGLNPDVIPALVSAAISDTLSQRTQLSNLAQEPQLAHLGQSQHT